VTTVTISQDSYFQLRNRDEEQKSRAKIPADPGNIAN
jgi:hypothetical protein